MSGKDIVRDFIETVFNAKDLGAVDRFMRDDYVQHNPGVAQGKQGFVDFCKNRMFLNFPGFRQEIKHIYEDGDVVVVHLLAVLEEGKKENIVFDVYRLKDGMLAEHWDCIQHLTTEQIAQKDSFF